MKRILVAVALLAGCAAPASKTHTQPAVMYSGDEDLANTAVLAAFDFGDSGFAFNNSHVLTVDGTETPSSFVGRPLWVRVRPGGHDFGVQFIARRGTVNYRAKLAVQADMQARHVYVLRYRIEGDEVRCVVDDLGEDPDFGITLGLGKVRYKAEF